MTDDLLLTNATVLDTEAGTLRPGQNILVLDGQIAEVGQDVRSTTIETLDLSGRIVMPGLVDAHVHVTAGTANLGEMTRWSPAYVTAHAARIMKGMLARGFTTVRDVGGADFGLAAAVEEGLFVGPRLVFGGQALSQTGGHGDMRWARRGESAELSLPEFVSRLRRSTGGAPSRARRTAPWRRPHQDHAVGRSRLAD